MSVYFRKLAALPIRLVASMAVILIAGTLVSNWYFMPRRLEIISSEMVRIPPGTFCMGDLNGGGYSDEKPVREIAISYAFEVGKYEVRFDEWDACIADGGCSRRPGDEGWRWGGGQGGCKRIHPMAE